MKKAIRDNILFKEASYKGFIKGGATAVLIIQLEDNEVTDYNEQFKNLVGYNDEEISKKDFWNKVIEDEILHNIKSLIEQINEDNPIIIDTTIKHKSSETVCVQMNIISFNIENKTYIQIMLSDITARIELSQKLLEQKKNLEKTVDDRTSELVKANEKLKTYLTLLRKQNVKVREANHMKDIFMANTSHELRTPLNSILGFTQLLRRKTDDAYVIEKLDKIIKSAEKLLGIINDILLLSEMSSEQFELHLEEVDLRDLIREIVIMNSSNLHIKHIDFRIDISSITQTLISDKMRLKQILYNLISNAIKYSDNNSQVKIKANIYNKNKNYIEISIEDKGIGIASEDIENIFSEFVQVQNGFDRSDDGLGIGLSVTKKIVEKLGGKIWVDSEINRGSVFSFTIPLVKDETKQENTIEDDYRIIEKNLLEKSQDRKTILIVEDTLSNLELFEDIFQTIGNFTIYSAMDGKSTLKILKENKIDLILIDIRLQDENGLDIVKKIRLIENMKNIPILAVSAFLTPNIEELVKNSGCNGFITKPITDINVFSKTVLNFLVKDNA